MKCMWMESPKINFKKILQNIYDVQNLKWNCFVNDLSLITKLKNLHLQERKIYKTSSKILNYRGLSKVSKVRKV